MQPEEFAELFSVSRETLDRLAIYERLLKDWGKTLSLVSRSTLADVWQRHFADSAQVLPLLRGPVLDMGTGAGFPGMVLAIMGAQNIHLSDNNQKKIAFLRAVADETGTAVMIHNCKAESVPACGFQTITARGLASLDDLLTLSARFFTPVTQAIFLKGASHGAEITAAQRRWAFDVTAEPSLTNPDSALLCITHLERRKAA